MTIKQLLCNQTQPDLQQSMEMFNAASPVTDVLKLQARVAAALTLLLPDTRKSYHQRFMLVKASESDLFFSLLQQAVKNRLPANNTGFAYHLTDNKVTLTTAKSKQDNFAATDNCLAASWVDNEHLFGCVRQPEEGNIKLQSGLVHHANGGVLILGLRTLLSQLTIWERLKHMVSKQEYDWFSTDDSHPLPLSIPSMPLDLRIILVGDRISLADLQEYDPEFYATSLYAEFENELATKPEQALTDWAAYLKFLSHNQQLPPVDASAFPQLIKEGVRHTEDQYYLPLSPDWLTTLLTDAAHFTQDKIDAAAIKQAVQQKEWRENYLLERFQEEIFSNQLVINTQEQIVGQINGLSVIEYPGYPREIGEPTRLSCLVHFGDGEFIDIERKNELAGNIHSKGMMIMQAFIMSEFAINHQLPFSASLVFEQSYSEVDGDSASLAGLCVLMSALSGQPIDQQLAVTGSVDQFGHVQSIGGVNEKIAGFFAVCKHQGLTGQQGVIIPASNQRHLCLSDEICLAIEKEQFSIWTVEHVAEALYLLMGIPYKDESTISIYKLIQARIQTIMNQEKKSGGWLTKWYK